VCNVYNVIPVCPWSHLSTTSSNLGRKPNNLLWMMGMDAVAGTSSIGTVFSFNTNEGMGGVVVVVVVVVVLVMLLLILIIYIRKEYN
jgi:hypothetical protein